MRKVIFDTFAVISFLLKRIPEVRTLPITVLNQADEPKDSVQNPVEYEEQFQLLLKMDCFVSF